MESGNTLTSVLLADGSTKDYSDVEKELCDKLAWAFGSTLRVTYGRKSKVFIWASFNSAALIRRWQSRGVGKQPSLPSLHDSVTPKQG